MINPVAVPYKIHTVLTDNGTHFTDPTGDGWTPDDIKVMRKDNVLTMTSFM